MSKPTTYIKLDRGILDWEWFSDGNTLKVWLYMLCRANYKVSKLGDGHTVRRGEVVLTYPELIDKCRLTLKQARIAVKHLISSGEVAKSFAGKYYTVYRIVNYCKYQDRGQSERQSKGQSEFIAAQAFEPF